MTLNLGLKWYIGLLHLLKGLVTQLGLNKLNICTENNFFVTSVEFLHFSTFVFMACMGILVYFTGEVYNNLRERLRLLFSELLFLHSSELWYIMLA